MGAVEWFVEGTADEEVSGAGHSYSCGAKELRAGGRAAIAAEAEHSVTGYRGDDAGGSIDAANALVAPVRDEQVAGAVQSYAAAPSEDCARRTAAIAPTAKAADAGHPVAE